MAGKAAKGQAFKDALRPLRRALPKATPAHIAPPPPPAPEPEPVFSELFADVQPLKTDNRYPHRLPAPPHWPRHSAAQAHANPRPNAHITDSMVGWFEPATIDPSFVRAGMQRHTLKKLRQGHWPVVAELDLHGLSRFDAQQHLAVLLHRARQHGQCCVRVIHGKGLGSREGLPVLKQVIRTWLRHHPHVLAFCEADDAQGGAGALLVLLRRDSEGLGSDGR